MKPNSILPGNGNRRMSQILLIGFLMAVSFGLGVLVTTIATAVLAAQLMIPIAATGLATVALQTSAQAAIATRDGLENGDSAARKTILVQLIASLKDQPLQSVDPQLKAWFRPALEVCQSDSDPEVVCLSGQCMDLLEIFDEDEFPGS